MSSFFSKLGGRGKSSGAPAGPAGAVPSYPTSSGSGDHYRGEAGHSSASVAVSSNTSAGRGSSSDGLRPLFMSSHVVGTGLVTSSFKNVVALPQYVDLYEWIAYNVNNFVDNIGLFYSIVSDSCRDVNNSKHNSSFCTGIGPGSSISSSIASLVTENGSKPAAHWDSLLEKLNEKLVDESVFPTRTGREFSRGFVEIARGMCQQLTQVIIHIFYQHYDVLMQSRSEAHFNSLFAHFVVFTREFELLTAKDLQPLAELIAILENKSIIA
ncbi:Mob1/phocein [Ramicandelaber brevisporus]|nr:Mob1/phocein [Ramicandelaber brevisporus]